MRQPERYTVDEIKHWSNLQCVENNVWKPARPIGHNCFSWKWRWKTAYAVLIGKADVLF